MHKFIPLVILFLLLPLQALADTPVAVQAAVQAATPWQAQLMELILSTLGAVVTACVPLVALWLVRKLKLGHEVLVQGEVTRLVAQGVGYAEEQVRKQIALSISKTPTGGEKLQVAAEFVLGQLEQRKLPGMAVEAVKAQVEAHLGLSRPADTGTAAAGAPLSPPPAAK